MLVKIGFMLICIGAMMGDSENLLIPLTVIGIGCVLVKIGERKEASYEEETVSER